APRFRPLACRGAGPSPFLAPGIMIEPTETTAAAAAADTDPMQAEIDALKARLAEAETQAQAARDAQLRAMADIENTRRRLEREAQTNLRYASEKLLGEMLAVCDSLELGLRAADGADESARALAEGMQLTYRQLMS